MRITARAKQQTRQRLLRTGARLFRKRGFAETTTREIADAAGIANGTLFNYFPTKESLALSLFAEALAAAEADHASRSAPASPEEDLYAYIMAGLHRLEPYRHFVGEVFATVMSPFARAGACPEAEEMRRTHLERVLEILRAHRAVEATSDDRDLLVRLHLYWTVYLGVVAFWSRDESPDHTDTLVVLDQSLRLFLGSLPCCSPDSSLHREEVSRD